MKKKKKKANQGCRLILVWKIKTFATIEKGGHGSVVKKKATHSRPSAQSGVYSKNTTGDRKKPISLIIPEKKKTGAKRWGGGKKNVGPGEQKGGGLKTPVSESPRQRGKSPENKRQCLKKKENKSEGGKGEKGECQKRRGRDNAVKKKLKQRKSGRGKKKKKNTDPNGGT